MDDQYKAFKLYQMLGSPKLGGAEKLALEINKYVSTKQIKENRLIVPREGFINQLTKKQGLASTPYNLNWLLDPRRFRSLLSNLDLYSRMLDHSKGILHIHSPFVYGALRPFLLFSSFKTIVHIHLDFTEDDLRWSLRVPPDVVITCAKFIKPTVERLVQPNKERHTEIVALVNSVDTKKYFPSDRIKAKINRGINPNRPILLMAANLAEHKGQETAIRALAILKTYGYKPLLWLVGEEREPEGKYSRYLRTLAETLGVIDLIEFMGFRADVAELLHAADFLLLPSSQEGLPLAVLEAQASKVVVLAAPTAGIPEVIEDGKTGFLICAKNADEYARQIIHLLTHKELAKQVEDAAFCQVTNSLNLTNYCDKAFEIYQTLI